MRIITIVGTRPEIIKMSEFLQKADAVFDHILVHTGQNYSSNLGEVFFQDLGLKQPDYWLDVASDGPDNTLGNIINYSYDLLKKLRPDAVIVYGDTNSCLSAISAKRLGIKVFHIEAGNRSFDSNLPEEMNRRIVDHICDVNICLSSNAKAYLIQEGIRGDKVFNIGSPMKEIYAKHREKIESFEDPIYSKSDKYILLSLHRDYLMNRPALLNNIIKSIVEVASSYGLKVLMSAHPRAINLVKIKSEIFKIVPAVGYIEFVKLMKGSVLVCSDSGTITEEAFVYGVEAISIRNSHERPEGMEGGQLIHAGYNVENIKEILEVTLNHEFATGFVSDYDVVNWSDKLIKIVITELCKIS